MIDDDLRELVVVAVAEAQRPLVAELRALRAALGVGRWTSRQDAAEVLRVSIDTIDRRIADHSLQSRRLGRSVRVLLEPSTSEEQIAALARAARGGDR